MKSHRKKGGWINGRGGDGGGEGNPCHEMGAGREKNVKRGP